MTLDEIERLARAATPGPWGDFDSKCYHGDPDDGLAYVFRNEDDGTVTRVADCCLDKDAAYVAAVHPQAILDLIARAKAADEQDVLIEALKQELADLDRLRKQVVMLRSAADYALRGFYALADEIEARRPGWIPDREILLMVKEGECVKSIADVRQALSATADLDGYVLVEREEIDELRVRLNASRFNEDEREAVENWRKNRAMLDAHKETGKR